MNEILKILPAADGLPMYIRLCGISYCDGSYHIVRDNSDVTVVEYVTDGEGYVTVDGSDHPVTKDSIYILKNNMRHNYYSCDENPWQKIFINITGDLPQRLMREYGIENEWLFDGTGLKYIFERIERVIRSNNSDAQCQAELSAAFIELLTRLNLSKSSRAHSDEAAALKAYLDDNMERIVSNRELSGRIYRSPDYCVKLFGREYGITPYEYQLSEKMSMARCLLRNTSMTVADVAQSVGYGDAQYFSGLFRKKCGITPGAYRRKHK